MLATVYSEVTVVTTTSNGKPAIFNDAKVFWKEDPPRLKVKEKGTVAEFPQDKVVQVLKTK